MGWSRSNRALSAPLHPVPRDPTSSTSNEENPVTEPHDTIERIHRSHQPGQALTIKELFDAAALLDSCTDKSAPGFAAARKRVESQLEENGY